MPRQFDLRSRLGDDGAAGLTAGLPTGLPADVRVRVNRISIASEKPAKGAVSGLERVTGSFVSLALSHLASITAGSGLEAGPPAEFIANPWVGKTNSGAATVYAQQIFQGIPVFQAAQTVVFDPTGALDKTTGTVVGIPTNATFEPRRVQAVEAVLAAGNYMATHPEDEKKDIYGNALSVETIAIDNAAFKLVAQFTDRADLPSVVSPGPFANYIPVSLVWFAVGEVMRPAWNIVLTMPSNAGQYRVLVDAASANILYCAVISKQIAIRGRVFRRDGGHPEEEVPFPMPLQSYGIPLPGDLDGDFPYPWVDGSETAGPSVIAHAGDGDKPVAGVADAQGILFRAIDGQGMSAAAINAFYLNCYVHDFFYLLGFRESDGNFQSNNLGKGGIASDRVDVGVYPGTIWATANMTTPPDGRSPSMKLGLVTSTGRHTAFDASVVFHEASHGVTNRLVGGPLDASSLEAAQSAGMSEGWSDFFACQMLGTNVVGAWVTGTPVGVRDFPYDENFPATFADLGKGAYTEMHSIGQIWCATLMALSRAISKDIVLRLMVDSLKLLPANPSFLEGRDAMLLALEHLRTASVSNDAEQFPARLAASWAVFARAGMGRNAASDGPGLTGVVADFSVPAASVNAQSWSNWRVTGPASTIPPRTSTTVLVHDSVVELHVIGADGAIYSTTRPVGTQAWTNWQKSGPAGTVPSNSSIAGVAGSVTLEIYVVGGDGAIYSTARSPSATTWSNWRKVGPDGLVPTNAALSATIDNEIVSLYVVGGDGFIYSSSRQSTGSTWSRWARVAVTGTVPTTASIAVVTTPPGSTLYVVGGDGHVYAASRQGVSSPWSDWRIAGPAGSVPSNSRLSIGMLVSTQMFVVGSDGRIYSSTFA